MGILCDILVLYDLFHEYVKKTAVMAVFRFVENKKEVFIRPLKMTRTGFEPVLPP
ncbi:hypothetical protein PAE4_20003 [Bacillus altitudinis]|nr:hypothetical protein PAE4_20003 [Bacillus altitudinis]